MNKILIVDDEPDIFYLLRNIFRQRNIETTGVSSIQEALESLKQNGDYFLIFLDIHLPDGLGYQYIQQFKKLTAARIVMLTAYDTSRDRKAARECGADHFIGKPFTREAVLKIADRFLAPGPS